MVILSIVACLIQQSGFAGLVTHFDRLREMIRQSGAFGYTLYILLFIVATLFLLPGTLLVIDAPRDKCAHSGAINHGHTCYYM